MALDDSAPDRSRSPAGRFQTTSWSLVLAATDRGTPEARAALADLFDRLKATLTGAPGAGRYAAIAHELGMTEGAVKVAASRLRRRYQEILREEIGRTVDHPAEVDEEIRDLFTALGG